MKRRKTYYQDGGDPYDTSVFNEAIDEIVEEEAYIEEIDEEEEYELEPEEEAVDDTEALFDDGSEPEQEEDIFEMLLNDTSFDLPVSSRINNTTNNYVRTEQKRIAIGQKQAERNQYAYDKYLSMGLNKIQAAAIVGNLAQESGIRPLNFGDRDSKGVAQWRTDRYKPMISWAKAQGKDPNALDTQLEYVAVEATQRGDLQRIANIKDVRQATIDFGRKFERPSEQHANWFNRTSNAESVYRKHGGTAQYGPSFKVPQPEVFKVKQSQDSPNKDLLQEEFIKIIGNQAITQMTPVTSEPNYLTVKRTTNTGKYELPDQLKAFNMLAQGTTYISNLLNSQRKRRKEQEQIEEDMRKPVYDNFGVSGISNIPSYNI